MVSIRYFSSQLNSGSDSLPVSPQCQRDNLIGLIDMFILCQPASLTPLFGGAKGVEDQSNSRPPLNPVEEMQLLLTIQTQLEEQKSLQLRYCIFEAIFGEVVCDTKVSNVG